MLFRHPYHLVIALLLLLLVQFASVVVHAYSTQSTSATTRLVVTFHTAADNNQSAFLSPYNFTCVKQYGRRLVLDLGRPFDLDTEHARFQMILTAVQSVDPDLFVGLQQQKSGTTTTTTSQTVHDAAGFAYGDQLNRLDPAAQPTPLWNLMDSEPFSIHAESVWPLSRGEPDAVVAVIDSGLALAARSSFLYLLEGYDFISDDAISLDDDGRDPDATDPGDLCQTTPGWHGTKVASVLAARHDNALGMKGVAPHCSVLPVRVLGLCSMGYATDVTDAIVWASGGVINGLSTNPRPAKILSLSLAGQGACPGYLQSAVNQAMALGAVVIAAAGNTDQDVSGIFPANCEGVVAVGASTRDGYRAPYSNWGLGITLSAPGGDSDNAIMMLGVNALDQSVELAFGIGTSFAAPHAAGVQAVYISLPSADLYQFYYNDFELRANYECLIMNQCGRGIISMSETGMHSYYPQRMKDMWQNSSCLAQNSATIQNPFDQQITVTASAASSVTCPSGFYNFYDTCCANGTYCNAACSAGTHNAIYVGDRGAIRKVSTVDGSVVTVAGNGVAGYVDGVGTSAQINNPKRMQFTENGTLIIFVETSCIKSLDLQTYQVKTLVGTCGYIYTPSRGTQTAVSANVYGATDALLHSDGERLFIMIGGSYNWIRVLNLTSMMISDAAGQFNVNSCADGVGKALNQAGAFLQIETNIILISALNSIRRWDLSTGNITDFAGKCGIVGNLDGTGTDARFDTPWTYDFTASRDRKTLFWHAQGLLSIQNLRKITYPGAVVTTIFSRFTGNTYVSIMSPDMSMMYYNDLYYMYIKKGTISPETETVFSGITGGGNIIDSSSAISQFANPFGLAIYPCLCGVYGNETCSFCSLGSVQIGSSCSACDIGTYNAFYNATACTNCSKGFYMNSTGSPFCIPCAKGKYATVLTGATTCAFAPTGSYSTGLASTAYTTCPPITYATASGSTACATCSTGVCATGQYTSCPSGYYNFYGACCAAGTYCNAACTAGTYNAIYVGDFGTIRKVSTVDGSVVTVAGNGTQAYVDGIGKNARIFMPNRMQFSPDGTMILFVEGYCVRIFNVLTYEVKTLIGNCATYLGSPSSGTEAAASATINGVTDVILHSDGVRVFFLLSSYHFARVLNLNTMIVSDIAGRKNSGVCESGVGAALSNPGQFVQVETNIILISADNSIRKWDLITGNITDFAGQCKVAPPTGVGYVDGTGTNARFTIGIINFAVSQDRKTVFWHDRQNSGTRSFLRKITYPGAVVTTIFTQLEGYVYNFVLSADLSIVYFNNMLNDYIQKGVISPQAVSILTGSFGVDNIIDSSSAQSQFAYPATLAIYPCLCGVYGNESCPFCSLGSAQSGSTCSACDIGKNNAFYNATVCTDCSQSFYMNSTASPFCIPCSRGKYATVSGGATSESSCLSCVAGQYSSLQASFTCQQCAAGRFSTMLGASACQTCGVGTFSSSPNTTCTLAPSGSYSSGVGATAYTACTAGTYATGSGSSRCLVCATCATGTYTISNCSSVTGTNGTCGNCTNKPLQASFTTACSWMCNNGYYYQSTTTSCQGCPVNYWCANGSLNACPPNSALSSTLSAAQSDCTCNIGYYGSGGWNASSPLKTGQLQPPTNWSGINCVQCPSGKYSTVTGITASSQCLSCAVGSYFNFSGCSSCAAGTYSAIEGASVCQNCGTGTFSNSTGASKCQTCANCYVSNASTVKACLSSSDTVCECQAGFYGKNYQCTQCPPNTNSTPTGGNATSTLLNCVCLPGYTCVYTKKINVVIRVNNMTLAQFSAYYNATFINAIAQAAKVDVSQVNIVSVMSVVGARRRRLLSQDAYYREKKHDFIITLTVHQAHQISEKEVYNNVMDAMKKEREKALHFLKNREHISIHRNPAIFTLTPLDFSLSWEPAHQLQIIQPSFNH